MLATTAPPTAPPSAAAAIAATAAEATAAGGGCSNLSAELQRVWVWVLVWAVGKANAKYGRATANAASLAVASCPMLPVVGWPIACCLLPVAVAVALAHAHLSFTLFVAASFPVSLS